MLAEFSSVVQNDPEDKAAQSRRAIFRSVQILTAGFPIARAAKYGGWLSPKIE